MRSVVIAGYARSPFHLAHKGELARVRPDDILARWSARWLSAPASTRATSRT